MTTMLKFDGDKCVGCGGCSAVCPSGLIRMEEKKPVGTEEGCILCGQCVAVCPTGAVDHARLPLKDQSPIKGEIPDAELAARFLRSRRSIRHYRGEPVAREKIIQLLDVARMAPTGGNSQGVTYHVVDDRAVLAQMTEAVVRWLEEKVAEGTPMPHYIAKLINRYRTTGYDVILRGAPALVIALADSNTFPMGRDNGHFSLTYAELYAPSIGLGTCWAGGLEFCAGSGYKPLLDLLQLPEGKGVAGAIMVGVPRYKYHRLVDRNPLEITWQS